ncbi:ribosome biogenesis GTP-binding protein YihA/YsxC [Scatolibacter rhodanostii]|uniref:ribosome biogenesis GTP-binding protein YihA/YsxC n=1 Tax=Scatolibacter rhodanostii TaxID=2014781 RepID=UPI000C07C9AA|nr:ribosome biogenesis GTP-binding protein YihA/YsxC [Scatolibacter rhodanostii]
MNFQEVSFEFAAGMTAQLPTSDMPEIVFSGKSNVGKSSLINKLINRKALARVSTTPGKTATINSYLLQDCRLIDLPGYGYAKVSQSEKQKWAKLVEGYFAQKRNIHLVIQLLDMRHKPTADDIDMINFLIQTDLPFIVACTKADKLNKSQTEAQKKMFEELFTEHEISFYPFSATKAIGVEELREVIEKAIHA